MKTMGKGLISKLNESPLSASEIDILREVVYKGYDSLLNGKQQQIIEGYPKFHTIQDQIYWTGDILEEIEGRDFLLAKIKEQEKIEVNGIPINLLYSAIEDKDFKGIDLFENYSGKFPRPVFMHRNNIVVISPSKTEAIKSGAYSLIRTCADFYSRMMRLKRK